MRNRQSNNINSEMITCKADTTLRKSYAPKSITAFRLNDQLFFNVSWGEQGFSDFPADVKVFFSRCQNRSAAVRSRACVAHGA